MSEGLSAILPGPAQRPLAHDVTTALASVIRAEAEALLQLSFSLPAEAYRLVAAILAAKGKVVFSGIGKSGLVARKLVATFSSLGIASFFLHPTEAVHGDLGAVQPGDLFVALSKSGTGWELEYMLPVLQSQMIQTVLICCQRGALADRADLAVVLPLEKEACTFGLAPTSSSTLMMAFGDALAVVVSSMRSFTKQAFARNHPAGALGKKLLFTVRAFMLSGQALPLLAPDTPFRDLLVTITAKKCGVGIVVDEQQTLLGIVTDGDLRRACEMGPLVFTTTAGAIATARPKTIGADALAYVALQTMEEFNITTLVVVEHERVVGLLHIHDLVKAGITA